MYFTFVYEAASGKAYALQCMRETQEVAEKWAKGLKDDYGPLRKLKFIGCVHDDDITTRQKLFEKAKTKAEKIEQRNKEVGLSPTPFDPSCAKQIP